MQFKKKVQLKYGLVTFLSLKLTA